MKKIVFLGLLCGMHILCVVVDASIAVDRATLRSAESAYKSASSKALLFKFIGTSAQKERAQNSLREAKTSLYTTQKAYLDSAAPNDPMRDTVKRSQEQIDKSLKKDEERIQKKLAIAEKRLEMNQKSLSALQSETPEEKAVRQNLEKSLGLVDEEKVLKERIETNQKKVAQEKERLNKIRSSTVLEKDVVPVKSNSNTEEKRKAQAEAFELGKKVKGAYIKDEDVRSRASLSTEDIAKRVDSSEEKRKAQAEAFELGKKVKGVYIKDEDVRSRSPFMTRDEYDKRDSSGQSMISHDSEETRREAERAYYGTGARLEMDPSGQYQTRDKVVRDAIERGDVTSKQYIEEKMEERKKIQEEQRAKNALAQSKTSKKSVKSIKKRY